MNRTPPPARRPVLTSGVSSRSVSQPRPKDALLALPPPSPERSARSRRAPAPGRANNRFQHAQGFAMTLVLDKDDDETRRPRTIPDIAASQGAGRMDQYDDDEIGRARVLGNGQVLAFIAGFWLRRRWRVGATVACVLLAIVFETWSPRAAQALVNFAAKPPGADRDAVWRAWAVLVGVFLASSMIRNLGFRFFWNPLAAHNMEEMTNEGFQRVQSFSARS